MYIAVYATDNYDDQEEFENVLDKYPKNIPLMLIDNDKLINTFMMVYAWSRRRTCEYVTLDEALDCAFKFIIFRKKIISDDIVRDILSKKGRTACKFVPHGLFAHHRDQAKAK